MARVLCLGAIALLLVQCGGNQVAQPTQIEPQPPSAEAIDKLLTEAAEADVAGDRAGAQVMRLTAGQQLVAIGDLFKAWNVLSAINSQYLPADKYIEYAMEYGTAALTQSKQYIAKRIVTAPKLEAMAGTMLPEQELEWRRLRAEVFTLLGDYEGAIGERLATTPLLLREDELQSNNDELWRLATALPKHQLERLASSTNQALLRGWYALAAISKNNQLGLSEQLNQVQFWRQQWPNHPANLALPNELRLLEELVMLQPKQVALLLPLSGRLADAGKAVREGFMAAYFQALSSGQTPPVVRVYDTNNTAIGALYDQAVTEGAQAVIGPLEKDAVEELQLRPALPVPTLALNYVVGASLPSDNLFQFGLASEDEGIQIAERAWRDGHRRAMILASDRDWGRRAADSFSVHWQALGGTLAVRSEVALASQFSSIVERSMLVDRSKNRARDLRRLTGLGLEFEPRSRDDVDMIFMSTNPGDARQLKPTLAFHYAGDIPVYGTSHLYDPNANSGTNNDLNGIRFAALPWYFDTSQPLREYLLSGFPQQQNLQNLHALGVDAFRVFPRLEQLAQVPETRLFGATGELYITNTLRIARRQPMAVMIDGQAAAMPMVVDSTLAQ